MKYRDFGTQNWKVSALGFACARLPLLEGASASETIDETAAIKLIRHAIDSGINYIETSCTYQGGQSEEVLGKALCDGYRARVRLATKLPAWLIETPEDFDRIFEMQLRRLQTDFVDCFLFQALNERDWFDVVLRYGLLEKAAAALSNGRMRHLGFSSRSRADEFEKILSASDLWSLCQFQFNYMTPESRMQVQLAADRGLAVAVMNPTFSGAMAEPPLEVQQVIDEFPLRRTPSEWALHWLWDQPEVSTVLSSAQTCALLDEHLHIACQSRPHCFGTKDQALIGDLRAAYKARSEISCTDCGECMPCPNGLDVPAHMASYNRMQIFESNLSARFESDNAIAPRFRAGECQQCGSCEARCPEKIEIREWMKEVERLLNSSSV